MHRLIVACAAALLLAACGGGNESGRSGVTTHAQPAPSRSGGGEEEGERGQLSKLPARDRDSYLQTASVIGVLHKDASLLQVSGIMRPEDTAALPVLRRRIAALRPRDALLERLRLRTLAVVELSIRSRRRLRRAERAAPTLLHAIARITRGLSRYATAHPAVGEFVPD